MDRVFLDANVLFSIAYDSKAGIAALLKLSEVEFFTSDYAAGEALRNISIKAPNRLISLQSLLRQLKIVNVQSVELPPWLDLSLKDQPILGAAIAGGATHLLTGDKDFRGLFGRVLSGVMVLRPSDYLLYRQSIL